MLINIIAFLHVEKVVCSRKIRIECYSILLHLYLSFRFTNNHASRVHWCCRWVKDRMDRLILLLESRIEMEESARGLEMFVRVLYVLGSRLRSRRNRFVWTSPLHQAERRRCTNRYMSTIINDESSIFIFHVVLKKGKKT
jgi:hypothetical protein